MAWLPDELDELPDELLPELLLVCAPVPVSLLAVLLLPPPQALSRPKAQPATSKLICDVLHEVRAWLFKGGNAIWLWGMAGRCKVINPVRIKVQQRFGDGPAGCSCNRLQRQIATPRPAFNCQDQFLVDAGASRQLVDDSH